MMVGWHHRLNRQEFEQTLETVKDRGAWWAVVTEGLNHSNNLSTQTCLLLWSHPSPLWKCLEEVSSAFPGPLWMPLWSGSQLCIGMVWSWRRALLVPGIKAEWDQSTFPWLVLKSSASLQEQLGLVRDRTRPVSLVSFYCWAGPWLQSMLPRCSRLHECLPQLGTTPRPHSEGRLALRAEQLSVGQTGACILQEPGCLWTSISKFTLRALREMPL